MFPFTVTNIDRRGKFLDLFLKNKPEGMTWYKLNLLVTSPTTGTFQVHSLEYVRDWEDGYSRVPVPTADFKKVDVTFKRKQVEPFIEEQLLARAERRRANELIEEERRIIALYAQEERANLGL